MSALTTTLEPLHCSRPPEHLIGEHGLSGADLSRLLGASRNLGPMILRGEREITAEHTRALGKHFALNPGVFIA